MEMKYMLNNYIVLGNGEKWCEKSLYLLEKKDRVLFINKRIPIEGKVKNKIGKYYLSYTLNKYLRMPLKEVWYKDVYCVVKSFYHEGNLIIIIFDHNVFGAEPSFIQYMKRKFAYTNIKFVYIFTNIVKYTSAMERDYVYKLTSWYDVVFAFDPIDAKKYNFAYSPLIYDADPNYKKEVMQSEENRVFYVGQAKDRLDTLVACFEKLKQLGIKTDFHIANVSSEDFRYADEIIYNKFMTYDEAVKAIQRATCLIDVIQGESTGLTIKTCEAVCYDKKLLTTNKHVVEYPFYDPRYIRVIESPEDIDEAFFTENTEVHYSEEGKSYFSANTFLKRLEKELQRRG